MSSRRRRSHAEAPSGFTAGSHATLARLSIQAGWVGHVATDFSAQDSPTGLRQPWTRGRSHDGLARSKRLGALVAAVAVAGCAALGAALAREIPGATPSSSHLSTSTSGATARPVAPTTGGSSDDEGSSGGASDDEGSSRASPVTTSQGSSSAITTTQGSTATRSSGAIAVSGGSSVP